MIIYAVLTNLLPLMHEQISFLWADLILYGVIIEKYLSNPSFSHEYKAVLFVILYEVKYDSP